MILSVDVGKGTEDILIIDPGEGPNENSTQAVYPSQTQLIYRQLIQAKALKHWHFQGEIMAGEPWHSLVYEHARDKNNLVTMTKTASKSVRYYADQVQARGIIIQEKPESFPDIIINTADIDWERIRDVLSAAGLKPENLTTVLLACQDHGRPPNSNQSSRDFRMQTIYQNLQESGSISDLMSNGQDVSAKLPRHKAIVESAAKEFGHLQLTNIYVMDSSPAVVNGVLPIEGRSIVINLGNGHTLASFHNDSNVTAIYETHTGGVTSEGLKEVLEQIIRNKLSHQDVLDSGGHGLFIREAFRKDEKLEDYKVIVIGPNRDKLKNFPNIRHSYPIANMMMAGPVGLYKAFVSIHQDSQKDPDLP